MLWPLTSKAVEKTSLRQDVAILYFRLFYIVIAVFTLLYSVALFYCFVRKAS